MLKALAHSLIEAIKHNGATSVFWAGLIEQVISPIPSVLIPMSGGVLLISPELTLGPALTQIIKMISFPYAVGATIGASVLYFLAFYGGKVLLQKYGKFFGLTLKNVALFRQKFTRGIKDELIIFFLLILPATPVSLVSASCGVIGIPATEFYPLLFLGTFIRSLFLGWLGWQIGEAYELVGEGLNRLESLLTLVGAAAALGFLAFLYYKRQKILKN